MLLEVVDVSFGYGWPHRPSGALAASDGLVLRDISLGLPHGTFVGILGPNGSGKTSLLRLLGGSVAPVSGLIRLEGRDVRAIGRRDLARRLAVVPQETHLAFDYTALEIVLMGRYPHLGPFTFEGPDDLAAAAHAMRTTGTDDLAARAFATLSGGEKQRVIIASALAQLDSRGHTPRAAPAGEPRATRPSGLAMSDAVLLLDEPTASLDLRYQIEIAMLLRRLNADQGLTVILSTHDLRLARALCARLVLLSAGRVLAEGPPAEVLTAELVSRLYGISAAQAAPVLA